MILNLNNNNNNITKKNLNKKLNMRIVNYNYSID